jgi:hypothetical protein
MEDSQHPVLPSVSDWSNSGPINTLLNTLRSATFNATSRYPVILARHDDATYASKLNALVEGGTCILSHRTLNHPDAASATKSTLNAIRSSKPFMPCATHPSSVPQKCETRTWEGTDEREDAASGPSRAAAQYIRGGRRLREVWRHRQGVLAYVTAPGGVRATSRLRGASTRWDAVPGGARRGTRVDGRLKPTLDNQ